MQPLNNVLSVSVVTPQGEELETRELHNVPMVELFPGEPVCIIDWLAEGKQPTEADVTVPVTIDGEVFHGDYTWGSAVKRG